MHASLATPGIRLKPLVGSLEKILQERLARRTEGLMFRSEKGTPLNLDNFARRAIPARTGKIAAEHLKVASGNATMPNLGAVRRQFRTRRFTWT